MKKTQDNHDINTKKIVFSALGAAFGVPLLIATCAVLFPGNKEDVVKKEKTDTTQNVKADSTFVTGPVVQ